MPDIMRQIMALALFVPALVAQAPAPATLEQLLWDKLAERVQDYDEDMDGVLGVAVIDLSTGKRWGYHADTVFAQASLIKVPILLEVFRRKESGQLRFDESVTLQANEIVGGSGVLQGRFRGGTLTVSVEELVREMIASSDNLATNWLIRRLGMAAINQTIRELGYSQTRLGRVMLDQAAASRNEENISTPNEMATIFERIYRGQIGNPRACEQMLDFLRLVKADLRKTVPAAVPVAAKPGEVVGVRTETGVVFLNKRPFVVSIMGAFLTEPQNPVPDIAKLVFAHMSKLDQGNVYGNLGVR